MFHADGPTFLELARQALSSTEQGYDLLAPKFERTPFRTPDPILAASAEIIGSPRSIASALDVCCGTGAMMRHLAPLCRERVVGLDFSAGMLSEAKRLLGNGTAAARFEFVQRDALEMQFENEFDVVTCFGALGHFLPEEEDRLVERIASSLRVGGRFVFATGRLPSPKHPVFWIAHGFNAVMRMRNRLHRPQFVMYYLTFSWPEVKPLLARHGLDAVAHERRCPRPFESVLLVSATKR